MIWHCPAESLFEMAG